MSETLVHLPKAITEPGKTESVSVAVIAHPWSLLGTNSCNNAERRWKHVRSCCTVYVWYKSPRLTELEMYLPMRDVLSLHLTVVERASLVDMEMHLHRRM